MKARQISLIFLALAFSIPILTAIFNSAGPGGRGEVIVGPTGIRQISWSFGERYFEWQIFGDNEYDSRFDYDLHHKFGISLDAAKTIRGLVDIIHPTLFHVSVLFLIIAIIFRRRSKRSNISSPGKIVTEEKKKVAPSSASKSRPQPVPYKGFVYLPLIAGWLVPGGGHFLLRKWVRGALLAASILGMFVLGVAMQGKVYASVHEILDMLGMVGDLGIGLPYLLSRMMGLGDVQVQTTIADWGTRFIVVAGLLNVIAAVDAHNLRTGRKS
jgi:hypothetical protein